MILHSWPTPNSYKVAIALREMGYEYSFDLVDIANGAQFSAEFLAKNPNNKIPVLTDPNGPDDKEICLFESGAILEYLADKSGKFLAPAGSRLRYEQLQWLYWQMAGFGPMLGQNHHFSQYAPEKVPYAIERYLNESKRLYKVLDHKLAQSEFVVGSELSIADFAIFPWTVSHKKQGIDLADYPALKSWHEKLAARPHFQAAYEEGLKLKDGRETVTEESRKILFGQSGSHLK